MSKDRDLPTFPPAEPASTAPSARRIDSDVLLGPAKLLVIEHQGREYRLRITANGKLILTA